MSNKPFAESCEQNKQPILQVLKKAFSEPGKVLEVGSGTGQHAVFFAQQMEHLQWFPTDIEEALPGIQLWIKEAGNERIKAPVVLDVNIEIWPFRNMDYAYTANTVHIVSWSEVKSMFRGVSQALKSGGIFCQYGPINYNGQYTSPSNEHFDQWLKNRDPDSGIRDFEDLVLLAKENNMILYTDFEMPANNHILAWQKR
ncbi:MAG: class I SAM-dependent methyltransferase [Gammaproteobacteria bacterium]|nr:class I SAM-dependent methyltransferase [Gammaproteobacteria bacterium]MCW9005836.1 class I SAM-dependent methyltransferase [Gammaproteobacteria bacterium]MCW9056872.1 class I SAM-dependent methyltransferase [Gammaproteobacteria bacterium]